MKSLSRLLICGSFILACSPRHVGMEKGNETTPSNEPGSSLVRDKVIYGEDDRLDKYEVVDPQALALMDSTVALIGVNSMALNENGNYTVYSGEFGATYNLCSDEPFFHQPVAAFCSGFLVAPDLIVTAGHCIRKQKDCTDTRFVFNYAMNTVDVMPNEVSASNVYSCAEIIHTQNASNQADFAVIKLDRAVTDHQPLRLRREGVPAIGDSLVVVGHPAGLPQKWAGGANVRSLSEHYFLANLDTYGGNSGSAVFHAVTREVEGILVTGETDFVTRNGCRTSNICADTGCGGEGVTFISNVLEYVPEEDSDEPAPPTEIREFFLTPQLAIPDNNTTGITSSLDVPRISKGKSIQVSVNIHHTYRGDLKLLLRSPTGVSRILKNTNARDSADNVVGTFGVDFVSAQALDIFVDLEPEGVWTLSVMDAYRLDRGTLDSWSIKFL